MRRRWPAFVLALLLLCLAPVPGCRPVALTVPHQAAWGIYRLDLATQAVSLVYSTPREIFASALRLHAAGDRLVFSQQADGTGNEGFEIYTLGTDGVGLTRLTQNGYMDVYPAWAPDGRSIAFLSRRARDLDIYVMEVDGSQPRLLYDSGGQDADVDWGTGGLVFTAQSAIWRLADDGQLRQLTHPPHAGAWGQANLPAGDYDPRLSPGGERVVFERLEDASQPHGGYNLFVVNADGTGETRLTANGWAQGLASWSHTGEQLVYVVAATGGEGRYDLYLMRADGSDNHSITPAYFPPGFLCHAPVFAPDDASLFFIGQWWA